jgi:hypothetical protein
LRSIMFIERTGGVSRKAREGTHFQSAGLNASSRGTR